LTCRNCEGKDRGSYEADPPELARRIADVRADVEFLRSAMEHWGGNSAEMAKARADIRDAAAAQALQATRIDDLAATVSALREDMDGLNRLVHSTADQSRLDEEKRTTEFGDFMNGVRAEVATLAARVSNSEELNRSRIEDRANELQGFIRSVDAEQAKGVTDLQVWRTRVDARLEEVALRAQDGDNALRHARRIDRALEDHRNSQKSAHQVLQDSLQTDMTSLLEKQALLSSELHRQMLNVTDRLTQTNEDLDVRLLPELTALRAEVASCRGWAAQRIDQCDEERRAAVEDLRASAAQELSAEAARLGARCDGLADDLLRAWAEFRDADEAIRSEASATSVRLERGLTECRAWAAEHVQAEYGRMVETFRGETESLHDVLACERQELEGLRSALARAEHRLDADCSAQREKLDAVSTNLCAAEQRLRADGVATSARLEDVAQTLARAEGRFAAEDVAMHERLSTAIAYRTQIEEQLAKRIESVSACLAAADSRLSCEDAAIKERLSAMSEEHLRTVAKQAEDTSLVQEGLGALAAEMEKAEARLVREGAVMRDRHERLAADVAELGGRRLPDLRTELLESDERLAMSHASLEQRLAAEGAAARERDEGLATTLRSTEAQLADQAAGLRERVEALAMHLSGLDHSFATRAAALAEQITAAREQAVAGDARLATEAEEAGKRLAGLAEELGRTSARLDATDAASVARSEAARQALDAVEQRLAGEDRVTKARLQALSNSVLSLDSRCSTGQQQCLQGIEGQAVSLTAVEGKLRSEIATVQGNVDAFRALTASAQGKLGAEDATLREKLERLAKDLQTAEGRMGRDLAASKAAVEQRFKEDIAWLLAMVQHSQGNVEKLAGAFRSLGSSHERCQSEFEMLENVVRGVEVRTWPWRTGVDHQGLNTLRNASPPPRKSPTPQRPSTARNGKGPPHRRLADSPLPSAKLGGSTRAVDSPPLAALRAVCNSPVPHSTDRGGEADGM